MAWMKTAGMINPQLLAAYYSEKTVEKNAFVRSGIVTPNPLLSSMLLGGGTTGKIPGYKALSGDSEVLKDGTDEALSVNTTTTFEEIYTVIARGKAFGASDLAKAFSGDDPMRAMGDMISDYWSTEMTKILINTLTGVFAGSGMAGLKHDISAVGDGKITGATFVDALQKLGDAASKIGAIAINSRTFAKLQKDQLIVYMRDSQFNIDFPTYLGKMVIVDDACPYNSGTGVCTSYLFTEGAFAYGGNAAPVPVETDRDSLAGVDVLITRYHMVLHPRGLKVNASGFDNSTPTNAELAGDIWTRVWEAKNMPVVQFLHKV